MIRTTIVCGLAFAAVLGLGTPGWASTSDAVVHTLAVSPDEQEAVKDYWTAERIGKMESDPPNNDPLQESPAGAGFRQATAADKSIGRLFFVDRDGDDSSCTATVVPSAGRSVAVTAGHCVHGFDLIGNDPQWTTKLLFVPGFRDNTMPFGSFPVRSVVVHSQWVADDQKSDYDQAFLVLSEHVPGVPQGIAFDQRPDQAVQQFGYPRATAAPGLKGRPEFIGMRLARCWGTAVKSPGYPGFPPDDLWGVACQMGGGSSGGPRIAHFAEPVGLGVVVGVNAQSSYIDNTGKHCDEPVAGQCTRHLVGPQFTKKITRPLYARALSG
ncbi:trypsin-like serine peptidase [Kibdelosporangium aridum]|uniref:trypsin-like serine peptidase n=1 Tax=Kibdelosporangium aridum TaxID=2030 RepID=UPI00068B40EA